jgi:hypothetical protein
MPIAATKPHSILSNQVHRGELTQQVVTSCACDRGLLGEWTWPGAHTASSSARMAACWRGSTPRCVLEALVAICPGGSRMWCHVEVESVRGGGISDQAGGASRPQSASGRCHRRADPGRGFRDRAAGWRGGVGRLHAGGRQQRDGNLHGHHHQSGRRRARHQRRQHRLRHRRRDRRHRQCYRRLALRHQLRHPCWRWDGNQQRQHHKRLVRSSRQHGFRRCHQFRQHHRHH